MSIFLAANSTHAYGTTAHGAPGGIPRVAFALVANEASVALGVAISKSLAVIRVNEINAGLAAALAKSLGVIISSEQGAGLAVALAKNLGAVLSSEVDAGLTAVPSKIVHVYINEPWEDGFYWADGSGFFQSGESSEANVALGVSISKDVPVGVSVEDDGAFVALLNKLVNVTAPALEFDLGQTLIVSKITTVITSTEVNIAFTTMSGVSIVVSIAPAASINIALAIAIAKSLDVVLTVEVDVGEVVALAKRSGADYAAEIDVTLAAVNSRVLPIDTSLTIDLSRSVIIRKLLATQVAIEIDGALIVVPVSRLPYLSGPFRVIGIDGITNVRM